MKPHPENVKSLIYLLKFHILFKEKIRLCQYYLLDGILERENNWGGC